MIGCRPLSPEECRRVESAFTGDYERRDRCLFVMGCTTGFRISELLSLRIRDVIAGPVFADEIRVRRRSMKGKVSGRSALVAKQLIPHLAEWIDELEALDLCEPNVALFLSRKSLQAISRQQAWRVLRDAIAAAGIFGPEFSLGTHTMRKSYADRMYGHFKDIFKVQKALQHASPSSTVAYLSFLDSEQREAIDMAFPTLEGEHENVIQFSSAANDD